MDGGKDTTVFIRGGNLIVDWFLNCWKVESGLSGWEIRVCGAAFLGMKVLSK